MLTKMNLPCQLLNACACTYAINNQTKNYTPLASNVKVTGWASGVPKVITGKSGEYYNAALVGIIEKTYVTDTLAPAIVVAFQGTIGVTQPGGLKDWLSDFDATPVAFSQGMTGELVHKGIYDSVYSIFSDVVSAIEALQKASSKTLPIFITGHSKGGGMAIIASAILAKRFSIQGVYTFAAPMVGNINFVMHYPSTINVQRYENYLDIIPFLMPDNNFITTLKNAANTANPIDRIELDIFIDFLLDVRLKHNAMGYVPIGILNYINAKRTIEVINTKPYGPNPGAIDLASKLACGIAGFVTVGNAHSHGWGEKQTLNKIDYYMGYMGGVCNHMEAPGL